MRINLAPKSRTSCSPLFRTLGIVTPAPSSITTRAEPRTDCSQSQNRRLCFKRADVSDSPSPKRMTLGRATPPQRGQLGSGGAARIVAVSTSTSSVATDQMLREQTLAHCAKKMLP